ncbi:hypothetical protein Vqi01_32840 [Micromonospora qiuiae]|uniref:DUF2892 domain-containing protein n=1 Tax=Micromonospora qiuiae TaxID=502268 RepID=A0ABQ4JD87_9ACTN|nr:hypothetical protein [Micromonospora qiuiae]GIJ28122.1 hypothetical protein Vqi01_32840 [Micromonospora qiuiae]
MNSGARIATAVGVGYLVGRRRKLRTALTLAAAVALGRASRDPGGLTKWGGDLLRASPQLSTLGQFGKPLASAGRAAATAAAGSGIDALSGRLRGSADALRRRGGAGRDEPEHEGVAGPDEPEHEGVAGPDESDYEGVAGPDEPEYEDAAGPDDDGYVVDQDAEASKDEEADQDAEAEQPDTAGTGGKPRRRKR